MSSGVVMVWRTDRLTGSYFPTRRPITGWPRQMPMKRIARAFGTEASDGPLQLFNLLGDIGAPSSLKDLGLPKSVLGEAADRVMLDRYPNPHPYDPDRIRVLLDDAWHGRQPTL